MPIRFPGSSSRVLIPDWKDSDASPTFVHPHPRHGGRRLRPTSANHPAYRNHKLHVVNDLNQHDYCVNHHLAANTACRTCGANPCWLWCPECDDHRAGTSSYAVPSTDRGSHPRILGPIRTRGRAMGDRHRLARIELPTRRSQPHWLLLDLPDGPTAPQGHLRGCGLSRLVRRTLRRQGLGSGRSIAVCVLGLLTLAALAREVL